jgi:hypothetical protein
MKRAVSVSLGSSVRDKRVELDLLGERVILERIGTDGDAGRARDLYRELDGQVDAFGVGGIDLSVGTDRRDYPIRAAHALVADVRVTPIVDGRGLKNTLEHQCVHRLEAQLGAEISPKQAMNTVALDRFGLSRGLVETGYQVVFGDLMFAIGVPIPLRSLRQVEVLAAVLAPILIRLPFSMLYPTGEQQDEQVPRFARWYRWATVIAGDCLYIRRHMPAELVGKLILTNTTTEADVERFREAGVRYLVTTTPRYDGRSFGTNMLEAALVAAAGLGRPLTRDELNEWIGRLGLGPNIERLND